MIGLIPTLEMSKATFYSSIMSQPKHYVDTLEDVLRLHEDKGCLLQMRRGLPDILQAEIRELPEWDPNREHYRKLVEISKTNEDNEILKR